MKILSTTGKWLFILCLPILLLSASLGWAANSLWLYRYGFHEYEVSQTLSDYGLELSDSELEGIYAGLINYFNSGEEYITLTVIKDGEPVELFTPEEVIHFRDVKGLIWLDYWILLGTLIYALGYGGVNLSWQRRRRWRRLAWGTIAGSGITLAIMLGLGLLEATLGFRQLFYQFHLLFFSNEFWSARGYMLLLFPEGFFSDAALFCALLTAGLAIALGGVSGVYLNRTRRQTA